MTRRARRVKSLSLGPSGGMVDAGDSKSPASRRGSSSLPSGTSILLTFPLQFHATSLPDVIRLISVNCFQFRQFCCQTGALTLFQERGCDNKDVDNPNQMDAVAKRIVFGIVSTFLMSGFVFAYFVTFPIKIRTKPVCLGKLTDGIWKQCWRQAAALRAERAVLSGKFGPPSRWLARILLSSRR